MRPTVLHVDIDAEREAARYFHLEIRHFFDPGRGKYKPLYEWVIRVGLETLTS